MSSPTSRSIEIPSLDGLRAISIMIVFLSHAGFSAVPGGLGVSIFFVISGFLITTLLRVEGDGRGRISLRAFYLRRVFRIFPVFYTVLILAILAVELGVLKGSIDADATASQFFHYYNFFAINNAGYQIAPGTGVYWSLAIEEHFYVVFPLIFVIMRRMKLSYVQQGIVLVAGCLVVLGWRLFLVYGNHVPQVRTYFGTDTRFDGLLFGCAAALIASPILDRQENGRDDGDRLRVGYKYGVCGLAVLLATLFVRDESLRETVRYTIQSIAIVACLRVVISAVGSPVSRLMNAVPIAWFGRMSYGFYLVHQVVISGIEERTSSRVLILVASFIVSTAAAWALHVVIERPVAKVRSRVLRTTLAPRAPVSSGAG